MCITYSPDDCHCQFGTTDLRGSLLGLTFLFSMPFILTLMLYGYTMFYVRTHTTALTTLSHHSQIRHDIVILTRLIFLFTFVITVAFPHILIPVFYVLTGQQEGFAVFLEWFLTWFSLAAANIIQLYSLTHSKKLWMRTSPVNPTTRMEQNARTILQMSIK
jgi:hypothetical protein